LAERKSIKFIISFSGLPARLTIYYNNEVFIFLPSSKSKIKIIIPEMEVHI